MLNPADYSEHEVATVAGLIKSDAYTSAQIGAVVEAEDFHNPWTKTMYEVVRHRRDAGITIDPASLRTEAQLRFMETAWALPGDAERSTRISERVTEIIRGLFAHPASTGRLADLKFHAEKVADAARVRRICAAVADMATTIEEFSHSEFTDGFGGEGLLARIQASAMALTNGRSNAGAYVVSEYIGRIHDEIIAAYNDPRRTIKGLDTGFRGFNARMSGLCAGKLIVVGAPRGAGKTSLVLDWVRNSCARQPIGWQIFSREMSSEEIATRMLYQESSFSQDHYNRREWDERDARNLHAARLRLESIGEMIDVHDGSGMTVEKVASIARQAKFAGRCGGIVVDYIQILDVENKKRYGNRTLEIDGIAKALKDLAMELRVPVITPSQLNKDGVAREGAGIENAADVVIILKPQEDAAALAAPNETGVDYIAEFSKNRSGGRQPVRLKFYPGMTRFEEQTFEANDGTQF